ncbi:endomucin isoform X2 [Rhinatrema bivittatum]|uniref:endomucin isoform X2 n=1 Tax=Rhinatrema bivittatum TaxID=194408 RepID=UPI00112BDB6C|nr:endomucin isoform X2 [Rhinatrema bivittatum]
MPLGTMKPFGAAVLFLALANVLSTTDMTKSAETATVSSSADRSGTTKDPSTAVEPNLITVSSANETDAAGSMNETTTSAPKVSATQTTSQHPIPATGSSANETGAEESMNETTTTTARKESESPTTTSLLSTSEAVNKTESSTESIKSTAEVHKNDSSKNITSTTNASNNSNPGQNSAAVSSGSNIMLPVFIPLGLVLFFAVTFVLYKMCKKTPPGDEAQNATEKSASDKESVKLLSVKTSPEAGEQSSRGRNKNQQHDESSPHLDHKYI